MNERCGCGAPAVHSYRKFSRVEGRLLAGTTYVVCDACDIALTVFLEHLEADDRHVTASRPERVAPADAASVRDVRAPS